MRMNASLRLLATLVAAAVALALVQQLVRDRGLAGDGRLTTADGDTVAITDGTRAAALRFGADVPPADRAWIGDAIARARPEAARLIAEVDGLVLIGSAVEPGALGVTRSRPDGFTVDLDLARLNNDRVMDRATVVLHELGHVIDFQLVPDDLVEQLDRSIPRGAPCQTTALPTGACTAIEERFADTFAKWALRGRISLAGSGYGIPAPASIEDWGAPLGLLAAQLNAR
jgi:hypothetical protein